MKFWLTVVVGILVVTGGTTALLVLSPTMQPTAPKAAKKSESEAANLENAPKAEVEGPLEVNHEYVTKGEEGIEVFKIKNEGKSTLVLTPQRATCQCTHLFIRDHVPGPNEKLPNIQEEHADHKVEPGKIGYVIAKWSTKDKDGKQNVGVPISTNDPRKFMISFRINLDIHKEFVPSSDLIVLGDMEEGQSRSASATIISLTRPNFEIDHFDVGSKWLKVSAEPLTPDEVKSAKAKAGYRIKVVNDPKMPVGAIEEPIVAHLKSTKSNEALRFTLKGRIWGDFDTQPEGVVVDFKEVTADTYRPRKIFVYAKKLDDSETLRVGTVKPENTIDAKIEKAANGKRWTLTVSIKPNAPGGNIQNGSVALVDSTGRERLVFRVIGLIDPGFRQTASR